MRFDINVFVYGKGRTLLSQHVHTAEADTADDAVEKAKAAYKGKGDSIVVRGVEASASKTLHVKGHK